MLLSCVSTGASWRIQSRVLSRRITDVSQHGTDQPDCARCATTAYAADSAVPACCIIHPSCDLCARYQSANERSAGRHLSHVSASIISFAVLALAVLQGLLVTVQSRQLRQHRNRGVIRKLPPLEAASALFFELTGAGFLILTVAIGSGIIFIDDLFSQHLVHKTVLTMLAWCLYAVLLVQYFRKGWRVQSAITLNLIAFGLVVLGFFGSKLVLELVLPAAG